MPCASASTLTPIASVPVLPPLKSVSASDAQALRLWAQQVLSQIQAAGGVTGVNVIPQQYALIAGATLPPIASTSNCTVTLDTANALYGTGSYKITLSGSPATVTFAVDTAWPIHSGWQWLLSFFQKSSAAVAGEFTVTTSGGTAYSTSFATTTSWARLYDGLNLGADTSTAFGISVKLTGTSGDIVWLDGLMLEPYYGRAMQPSPFISTSAPLTLDNNPDGTYAKILAAYAAGGVAFNFKGVYSATTAYVQGDEVVYGETYWLALQGGTGQTPATGSTYWQAIGSYSAFLGAWSALATYAQGAEVTYSGNFWIATTQNSNSTPSLTNSNWQVAGPTSASAISYSDGATVESLQPAQAAADKTSVNTAADTSKVNGVASASISPIANLMPAEANANVTASHTAADTSKVNGVASTSISPIATLMPAEANADVTATHTAAAIAGQGALATANNADGVPGGSSYLIPPASGTGETLVPNGLPNVGTVGAAAPGWRTDNGGWTIQETTDPNGVTNALVVQSPLVTSGTPPIYSGNFTMIPGATYYVSGWFFTGGTGSWRFAAGSAAPWVNIGAPKPWTFFSTTYTAGNAVSGALQQLWFQNNSLTADTLTLWGVSVVKVRGLDNEVEDGTTYLRMPGANMDANRRGLIDFTQAGHLNKTLSNIADDSTYWRIANPAVNSNHYPSATQAFAGGSAYNIKGVGDTQTLSLDSEIADGATYGRFLIAHFDGLSGRRVATINGAISPLGSIVTGSSTVALSYTSTASSIAISWTAGTLNRMDGTQTSVTSGSVTVTGLSASTTYYAAAYWDEVAQTISFVTGQSGAVGSPAILYPSESAAVAWQANLQARLNLGWVPVATTSSGTGGGNGSSGCCLRGDQLIELANGVMREAAELTTGDTLTCPTGPIRITQLRMEAWSEWYTVEFTDGRVLHVAPDHRFMDPAGTQIHARDLKLQQIVQAQHCYLSVARLELSTERALKVGIEVEEPHTYYVDGVLSHNKVYC